MHFLAGFVITLILALLVEDCRQDILCQLVSVHLSVNQAAYKLAGPLILCMRRGVGENASRGKGRILCCREPSLRGVVSPYFNPTISSVWNAICTTSDKEGDVQLKKKADPFLLGFKRRSLACFVPLHSPRLTLLLPKHSVLCSLIFSENDFAINKRKANTCSHVLIFSF
ncbi:hypothetical protein M5689_025082 [Euphorbia peplus]|nr:hypothetical protein M5689_025082 [Euphorbia peplus]